MKLARSILLVVLFASAVPTSTALGAQAQEPIAAPAPRVAADLDRERALLQESDAARKASDYVTARAKAAEAVAALLARQDVEHDTGWTDWATLMDAAAHAAWEAQDPGTAGLAYVRLLEVCSRTLSDDHPHLQSIRQNLASTMYLQGDLEGASALQEQVLEVRSRTLPDDHPDLLVTRQGVAITRNLLGDLAGARALLEKVVEVYTRTLPPDHVELQVARMNLASTLKSLGDLAGGLALYEPVVEVLSRTLPDDHPDLQAARLGLASTLQSLGDLEGARALMERVVEALSRTLPEDHLELQEARLGLAGALQALGELEEARALQVKVLEVYSRTLPDDDPKFTDAQLQLAESLLLQGELQRARALQETALEVLARTLPDDHPKLQRAREGLGSTLSLLGDLPRARALFEKVLEVRSRTLPADHPELQAARMNVASKMHAQGELADARALLEEALAVLVRTLPDDDPKLQFARVTLAMTLGAQGDHGSAVALLKKAVEVYERTLPEFHRNLLAARMNLAEALIGVGDYPAARALEEQVVEGFTRAGLEGSHALQVARENLARTIAVMTHGGAAADGDAERARCLELMLDRCHALTKAAHSVVLTNSVGEVQERCEGFVVDLDLSLSFAAGYGVFAPSPELDRASFVLGEVTRGAALASAALMRRNAGSARYAELRAALREETAELARLTQAGTTSAGFQAALARREKTERELVSVARELGEGELVEIFEPDALALGLSESEAVVSFRRYVRYRIERRAPSGASEDEGFAVRRTADLCAYVVRPTSRDGARGAELARVELGPIDAIETAVRAWRDALGVASDARGFGGDARAPALESDERGRELRRLVLDPLRERLTGVDHLIVALDDALHLVPLDALPEDADHESGSPGRCVGDRLRVETRTTLTELSTAPRASESSGGLVLVGGVAYGAAIAALDAPLEVAAIADPASASSTAETAASRAESDASILRGGAWSRGFEELPATGREVDAIARDHTAVLGADSRVLLLTGAAATRERVFEAAPRARWLHVATHGWFASDSIRSWRDPEPLDAVTGLALRPSGEEQVKGMSPMLLCGLALAGANAPDDELGRARGLITAEELSALDLAGCELAVLSACDTNVGERRAGVGVASLQMALQMAGAQSVITSLWKVPDEATRELMTDFYRRLWVERKPKWRALWEAKAMLRDARDENGAPLYTTRDWAAWVLTGSPE